MLDETVEIAGGAKELPDSGHGSGVAHLGYVLNTLLARLHACR